MKIWQKIKAKAKVLSPMAFAFVPLAADTSSAVTEWLPTIITFAMLGMVLGLLKKMGKW